MKLFFIFYLLSPHLQHKSQPWSPGEYVHFISLHCILFSLFMCLYHTFSKKTSWTNVAIGMEAPHSGWPSAGMSAAAVGTTSFPPAGCRACLDPRRGAALGPSCHHGLAPVIVPGPEDDCVFKWSNPTMPVQCSGSLCPIFVLLFVLCCPFVFNPKILDRQSMHVSMISYDYF